MDPITLARCHHTLAITAKFGSMPNAFTSKFFLLYVFATFLNQDRMLAMSSIKQELYRHQSLVSYSAYLTDCNI